MSETLETDVIIIGGGPIGLTLSCILGKSNIENIVLEKSPGTSDWPKANYINPRSMELLNRKGLDGYIREVSMPENFMIANCVSLTREPPLGVEKFTQEFIEKVHQKSDGTVEQYVQEIASQKPCRISQIQTEPALKKAAEELPSCSVRFGWEVTSVSQDEDGVTVDVSVVDSGERKTIEGRYLVECDGTQSLVRKSLGINYTGDFAVGKFRSVFFESMELRKSLYNPEFMAYWINRYDFRGIVVPVDTERLFVAHIILTTDDMDSETPEKPAEYYIKSILDNSNDIPFEILQDHSWKAHIVHAETFQVERMFLAGDSGHLVVPVGGIGMNAGILDVFNLGWKLTATVQGWGGEWLLDSYSSECLPFYQKIIEENGKVYRFVKSSSKTAIFFMNTPPFKYVFRAIARRMNKTVESEGLTYGVMLKNSPVCVPSGLECAIEDRGYYTGEAYSACRAPHFRFEDGSTLFSKLGEMFTLLCLSPCDETRKLLEKYAREVGMPLKVLIFDNEDLKKLYKAKMVLIRPDLYIAWCGDELPQISENDSLRTRARVLVNVVSGATPLPPEWAWSRMKRVSPKSIKSKRYWIVPLCSVLIGMAAVITYTVYS